MIIKQGKTIETTTYLNEKHEYHVVVGVYKETKKKLEAAAQWAEYFRSGPAVSWISHVSSRNQFSTTKISWRWLEEHRLFLSPRWVPCLHWLKHYPAYNQWMFMDWVQVFCISENWKVKVHLLQTEWFWWGRSLPGVWILVQSDVSMWGSAQHART